MKKLMRNSLMSFAYLPAVVALLAVPAPLFAKQGVHIVGAEILVEEETDDSGVPDDIDGPLDDKMSDSGALFGDLYRLARYKGGEIKKVPAFDSSGNPVYGTITWTDPEGGTHQISVQKLTDKKTVDGTEVDIIAVGGEPILTEDYAYVLADEEITEETDLIVVTGLDGKQYIVSPYPSQCVQPVADEKWGLTDNLIPLYKTYDATWERTECEVVPDIFIPVNTDASGPILTPITLADGTTYYTLQDISYADLVQEVEFGRLNLARAPQAVLDASFDEAIRSLNAAKDIKIDASGRLMVTTESYDDEFLLEEVVGDDGNVTYQPLGLEEVTKAIDSPKENLALYIKLMKDGHLITPADERVPIDYSVYGGMPINQLLELEDGPSDAPRPTIDIQKMIDFGLGHLVDAEGIVTYSIKMEEDGSLYLSEEELNLGEMVIYEGSCPVGETCDTDLGILDPSDSDKPAGDDFPVAASFFSAAADKKGHITVDKIVYINSILGINKVVGTGVDEDGSVINYAKNPVYFNFNTTPVYNRLDTFGVPGGDGDCIANRGRVQDRNGDELPDRNIDGSYVYDGMVYFLEETGVDTGIWEEKPDYIVERVFHVNITYPEDTEDPDDTETQIVDPAPPETIDIGGFNSMADDDLQVIKFTHTYQIPGLR